MATNGTLDERYLTWIVKQVEPISQRNPARSHWLLLKLMYQTEFRWFIKNDDNRLLDGLNLRQEFIDTEEGGDVPGNWLSEPCSFLEMLLALAQRMAFETSLEADYWFWRMVENLNLRIYVDETFDNEVIMLVTDILKQVIDRTYHADGSEGLFPLYHPGTDQRQVELWYQFQQYLMENVVV